MSLEEYFKLFEANTKTNRYSISDSYPSLPEKYLKSECARVKHFYIAKNLIYEISFVLTKGKFLLR